MLKEDYLDRPTVLVIFGISGDLAKRKLLPALYHLFRRGELPEKFTIVGLTRQKYSVKQLFADFEKYLPSEHVLASVLEGLEKHIEIQQMDMGDEAEFERVENHLKHVSMCLGEDAIRLYYLSIPAPAFMEVVTMLGKTGHAQTFVNESEWPRLLIEKPFGHNISSAAKLIKTVGKYFNENQLFRIDHFLAKETAQNLLTFRFDNPLFQSIWNSKHIESIEIYVHETIGIEGRANFYEQTGALRDIIQSHILQLLAVVTMERPTSLESESIHRVKLRLLQAIAPISTSEVKAKAFRGQYKGYTKEVSNEASKVETFARLHLTIDNEQWRGVDITVETGKALPKRQNDIRVNFRVAAGSEGKNTLIFRHQPNEGVSLLLKAKRPGLDNVTETVAMEFDYEKTFRSTSGDAYERVILDAIRGDQALFASNDEVMASWKVVEQVLTAWENNAIPLHIYEQGSYPLDE